MGKTQEQIDKLNTLVSQNGELIKQNTELVSQVSAFTPTSEVQDGTNLIKAAIEKRGISIEGANSLTELANKIKQLPLLSKNTIVDASMPIPSNMAFAAAMGGKGIIKAYDENVTSVGAYSFSKATTLEEVDFPNAESVGSFAFAVTAPNLTKINLPKVTTVAANAFAGGYEYNSPANLQQVNILNAASFVRSTFSSNLTTNLIDLIIGRGLNANISFSGTLGYNPSNAYSKTSSSLCFETDLEEYGQIFNTNWDKWKWCIINHFAANLQDRTGLTAFTITFGSTVLGKMDEEMKLAFTSKNWTLA
jgi:hypothetical protein